MARLNIIICDLCKSMSKVTLPFTITLQAGKGKDKETSKGEICSACYEDLTSQLKSEFEFDNSFSSRPRKERRVFQTAPIKKIAEGELIVPSNIDNVAPLPEPKCLHEKASLEDDDGTWSYFKCKECEEEWKV